MASLLYQFQNLFTIPYLFLFFIQGLMLFCVIMTIFSRNTVHSILYLVLVFCNATAMLLLLNLDYIAIVYLVVYIGAIAILFLFVVMMLNIKLLEIKENFWVYTPIILFMVVLFLCELLYLVLQFGNYTDYSNYNGLELTQISRNTLIGSVQNNIELSEYVDWIDMAVSYDNINLIGFVMYSYYGFAFVLSSFILLAAMLGSITLTLKNSTDTKRQDIFKQIQSSFTSSINLK